MFVLVLTAVLWPVESDAAQLTLTWTDNSTNEDGFSIERKTGPTGTFAQIATVGPRVTSYIDSGIASVTTYCYRLLAFNTAGNSAYSNEACGTTPQTFGLAVVRAGLGSGTVTSAPAGITCGTSCSASYASGTAVTLTATPAAGSTFTGWSGGGCSGTGSCSVTVTAAVTVTATFNQSSSSDTTPPPTPGLLSIVLQSTNATGATFSVTWPASIDQPSNTPVPSYPWNASYNDNQAPRSGTVSTNALTLVMPYHTSGTAQPGFVCIRAVDAAGNQSVDQSCNSFTVPAPAQNVVLTIAKAGTGSGTVTSTPAGITCGTSCSGSYASGMAGTVKGTPGINCGPNCSASYPGGTVVTLTANPATGSTFTGWSGGGCTGTGSCTVTMSAATTVTATFSVPVTLTSITNDKPAPQSVGTSITFTASASGGIAPYHYKWWLWNGTAWNIVQDWSGSATLVWTPTVANPNYQVIAWVRGAGNTTDTFESYLPRAFAINPPAPATLTGITTDKPAPQGPGVTITFTASASGGTAPYQYKRWLRQGTAWSIVQDWSASATFVWRPTTPNAAYQVIAWVRSAGNTADMLESYKQLAFAINPAAPATLTGITTDKLAPHAPGVKSTFSASASG